MLIFSDWIIKTDGDLIARQYDNLTRELLVMGTLPEGWAWELLVQAGGSVNVIALSPRKGGVGVTLTAEMLTKAGLYALQLRGGRGEEVRHTNVIQVVVPASLVGDATWPELPSEFSQAEANIRALNAHPPIPGDNGYWLLWDLETGDYVESQLSLPEVSVGPQGPEGKAASIRVGSVLTGEPGSQAAVSNSGTENNAILDFVLPRGQIGPTGPSGADGRDGKDGVPGAAATIQVGAVTTGEPGTQAQVINVGTENAAMLQFTIPRGQPGTDGRDGKNGQDGAPGPAGVGVPEISDGDEGKVMTARSGQAVWEAAQGDGGVQPDWDQNDPQTADFIKNRPFYETPDTVLLSLDGIQMMEDTGRDEYYIEMTGVEINGVPVPGETYTISVNGTEYKLQAAGDNGFFQFGTDPPNPVLVNLVVAMGEEPSHFLFVTTSDLSPLSIRITGLTLTPIEPRFLSRAGEAGFVKLEEISHGVSTGDDSPYEISIGGEIQSAVFRASRSRTEVRNRLPDGNRNSAFLLLDTSQVPSNYYAKLGVGYTASPESSNITISDDSFTVNIKRERVLAANYSLDSEIRVQWTIIMVGGVTVTGLPDPTGPTDAATKGYVDARTLPTFTADDEGKVLKIVDGVPTWVTP